MTSQKKIKNLVSAYSAIRIDYGDFMDEILLDLKEHGFSSEALLRLGVIDIPGKSADLAFTDNEEFEKKSVHWLFNEYTSLCQDAGDEPEDITDSLERMGFTCEEMAEYGFEGVEAEDDFQYEEDEAPAVVNVVWPRALHSLQSRGTAIRCGLRTIPWKSVRTVRVRSLSGQQVSPDARAAGSQSCPARPAVAVRRPALMGIPAGSMSI